MFIETAEEAELVRQFLAKPAPRSKRLCCGWRRTSTAEFRFAMRAGVTSSASGCLRRTPTPGLPAWTKMGEGTGLIG